MNSNLNHWIRNASYWSRFLNWWNSKGGPTFDVVLGLIFGDEGKGKIVYDLLMKNTYTDCVRFMGGPNAGHTIIVNGQKVATHQVPSGALHGVRSSIGPDCLIDLEKLDKELAEMEKIVPDIRNIIFISGFSNLIRPKHIAEDKANDKVGSTHCGMGPCYRDKTSRCGVRVEDLFKIGFETQEGMEDIAGFSKFVDRVHYTVCGCKVVDVAEFLRKNAKHIMFEGAQGILLDINSPYYPFVTSTKCDLSLVLSCGVDMRNLHYVYGAAKIYTTYVGKMNFQPKFDPSKNWDTATNMSTLDFLAKKGGEKGTTTGRHRQCNWLDLDLLVKACALGVDVLIINKCDIVQQVGVYKLVCTDGTKLRFETKQALETYFQTVQKSIVSALPKNLSLTEELDGISAGLHQKFSNIIKKDGVFKLYHQGRKMWFETLESMQQYITCVLAAETNVKEIFFSFQPDRI